MSENSSLSVQGSSSCVRKARHPGWFHIIRSAVDPEQCTVGVVKKTHPRQRTIGSKAERPVLERERLTTHASKRGGSSPRKSRPTRPKLIPQYCKIQQEREEVRNCSVPAWFCLLSDNRLAASASTHDLRKRILFGNEDYRRTSTKRDDYLGL